MKLFILLSRFPFPLDKGDKLRAYHQIKELSKNHEIYLFTLSDQKIKKEDYNQLKSYCQEVDIFYLSKFQIFLRLVFTLFFKKSPLQLAYFFNRNAKRKIRESIEKNRIEHIYCQLIRTTDYVKDIQNIPKTLDYMDALSRGLERRIKNATFYLKPFLKLEAKRLKKYEHLIFKQFNNKTIISEQDRDLIVHAKNDEIVIVPNGVSSDYYHKETTEKKYDIIFTGNMSYPPNIRGAEYLIKTIMPIVWKTNPSVNVVIAGTSPTAKIKNLANEKITITGWVKDIRTYYNASNIFVAPMLIGTGLQNKLLEAMSMEIPCVTSKLANNALGAKDAKEILIAQNPEAYAKHILNLINNKKLAKDIATSGKNYVLENFSWQSSTTKLEALFLKS